MLVPPTRTCDGRPLDGQHVGADGLLVSIDRPTRPDIAAFSGEAPRFEGWAMSLDPEPWVRVLVDSVVEREFCMRDYLDWADHTLALTDKSVEVSAGFEIVSVDAKFLPFSLAGDYPRTHCSYAYLRFPVAWRMLGRSSW